jgi:hypothetical protein
MLQSHGGHDQSAMAQSQPLGFLLLPQSQWRPEVSQHAHTSPSAHDHRMKGADCVPLCEGCLSISACIHTFTTCR